MIQGWNVAGKAWVGFGGSLLAFLLPYIVRVAAEFPQPWPALVGAIVALLTAFGVYKAPYSPAGQGNSGPSNKNTPWPSG